MSSVQPLVDAAGRRRSPATMPAFRAGRAPRNKGQRYPADPPPVEEIVALMRAARAGSLRRSAEWSDRRLVASGLADPRGAVAA
jgi:hypothetical protein